MKFTAEEKAKCAARELRFRERAYPRLIENGKMTKLQMERETALMEAIQIDYIELAEKERLL